MQRSHLPPSQLLDLGHESLSGREAGEFSSGHSLEGLNDGAEEFAFDPWGWREPRVGQVWVLERSSHWAGDSWG